MKKMTTIRIDEDVLKCARNDINNLSLFVEDCLKWYLGINEDNRFVKDMQDNLDTIKQAQLNIHLLNKSDFNNNEVKEFDSKKQSEAWLKIWGTYRNTQTTHTATLEKVSHILKTPYPELMQMMETLLMYVPKNELSFCDDWDYSVKQYEKIINGVD